MLTAEVNFERISRSTLLWRVAMGLVLLVFALVQGPYWLTFSSDTLATTDGLIRAAQATAFLMLWMAYAVGDYGIILVFQSAGRAIRAQRPSVHLASTAFLDIFMLSWQILLMIIAAIASAGDALGLVIAFAVLAAMNVLYLTGKVADATELLEIGVPGEPALHLRASRATMITWIRINAMFLAIMVFGLAVVQRSDGVELHRVLVMVAVGRNIADLLISRRFYDAVLSGRIQRATA